MLIKPRTRIALLAGLVLGWLLCAAATAAEEQPTQVKVTTTMGDFVIELRSDRAPITTANFLRYVREGFYTNTLFHRVIANFVIQGGGHDATTLQLKPTHESVFNESGNGLQNKRGTVGMARADPPHSGNAQFFVNLVDNPDLDPVPTRWGYTVFGRVVQGMDVIEHIGETPTGATGPFKSDAPLKPVIIQKMEIISGASAAAAAPVTPVTPPPQNTILSPK
jgi:cyclophilin family peptidyl-prolyl cis-trans isomerase